MYNFNMEVKTMSLLKATEYLKKFNKENDILLFDETTATVADAAKALRVSNNEIAKTLSFDLGNEYILIITAGDYKIDNHKFKEEFKVKAKMIERDNVENIIGHNIGGVCPFGVNKNIKVYLDESLKKYNYVYPACGTDNSAIKLTPDELYNISNAVKYINVCKEINYEG